jgi:tRNA threonylcarbamoyladenosine biosynthesis protein TsaE
MVKWFLKGNEMKEFKTFSVEETVELGISLGKLLRAGDVVCIAGDLGTGKTALTSGIARAMGIDGYITSPTFTIVNEYRASILYFILMSTGFPIPRKCLKGFEEYLEGGE